MSKNSSVKYRPRIQFQFP